MRRFAIWSAWLFLLALAPAARADTSPFDRNFDTVPVKHTPSLSSGIALEGAQPLGAGSWRALFLLDANAGILSLQLGKDKLGDLIPFRTDAHLLFAYQLLPRLELAGDLPFTLFQADNFQLLRQQGFPLEGVSAVGLGDLRLVPRFSIFTPAQFPVGLAVTGEIRFPTGDGQSFLGDRAMVFAPRLAAERTFGNFRVLGNLGARLRFPTQFLNIYVGNEYTVGLGALYRLPDLFKLTQVWAVGEFHLATQMEAPFTFRDADSLKTPLEVLGGIRARVTGRWGAELILGRGLAVQTGYGRESFRVMAALRYELEGSDSDGDGIANDEDRCPDQPEDRDGFQDADGCPEQDNDNDGVPDGEDKCPDVAGPKENGGCPSSDRDGDGVLDADDACPDQPGPKEFDGCPDRDGDDVPDNVDRCPDQPGPAENEGCPTSEPDVVLERNRIRIRNNVQFETGSAKIRPESFKILDEVYDVLAKHPEIPKVRIEGHTDNRGGRNYNLDLSQRRAKSVVDYLVKKGIAAKKLTPRGFGFDRPVASNDNALGRAKNRRVEFNLVQEGDEDNDSEGPQPEPAPEQGTPAPAPGGATGAGAPEAGTGNAPPANPPPAAEKPAAEKPAAEKPAPKKPGKKPAPKKAAKKGATKKAAP